MFGPLALAVLVIIILVTSGRNTDAEQLYYDAEYEVVGEEKEATEAAAETTEGGEKSGVPTASVAESAEPTIDPEAMPWVDAPSFDPEAMPMNGTAQSGAPAPESRGEADEIEALAHSIMQGFAKK